MRRFTSIVAKQSLTRAATTATRAGATGSATSSTLFPTRSATVGAPAVWSRSLVIKRGKSAQQHQQQAPLGYAPLVNFVHQYKGTSQDKPAMEVARSMPRFYSEMSNDVLLVYCAHEDHEAHCERLTREIMAIDNVAWESAREKLEEISAANKKFMRFYTLPYHIGLATALTAGFASIPLCFHLDTVMWFNEHYVTAEVAEPQDLETWLEVGSWAWNWMEPPLGQVSFFLLTLQFARNQMLNLGAKPYTHWLQTLRAKRLQNAYPDYNAKILADFAKSDKWTA